MINVTFKTIEEEYLKLYNDCCFDSGALEMPDPDLQAKWWLNKLQEIEIKLLKQLIERNNKICEENIKAFGTDKWNGGLEEQNTYLKSEIDKLQGKD